MMCQYRSTDCNKCPTGGTLGVIAGAAAITYLTCSSDDDSTDDSEGQNANGGDNSTGSGDGVSNDGDVSEDKPDANTVDDLISTSSKGSETTGRSRLYERPGGIDEANKDFDNLSPSDVKDINNNRVTGRVGTLPDGRTVIVRDGSSDGRATLEVQSGKNKIKFRYDN